MAISDNGPFGEHRGKIGNLVYYMLNGQQVARKNGRKLKPLSELQLRHLAKMKLINTFLKTLKEFVSVGFSIEKLGTVKNAFNLAVESNFQELVTGVYPDLEIDYPKLVLSRGKLKPAQNPAVMEVAEGFRFSWDTSPQMPFAESTDQVMMLAYFPLKGKAVYTLFGAERLAGTDVLQLSDSLKGEYAELYVAFISAGRKQLADSTYLGSFNKEV